MSLRLHDAFARRTPFEILSPDRAAVRTLLDHALTEAGSRGIDLDAPETLVTLPSVAAFLRETGPPNAAPELIRRHAMLLFHTLHFERAGAPLYLLSREVVRVLASGEPRGGSSSIPPSLAGYLQLPLHLIWIGGGEGSVPESVDGLFWTVQNGGVLHALAVTGVRADRPGVGVVTLPGAPLADTGLWLAGSARPEGGDFACTLPGGSLDGLYSIEVAGEVLQLLARFFAGLAAGVWVVDERPPSPGVEKVAVPQPSPIPSTLPFRRVSLDG